MFQDTFGALTLLVWWQEGQPACKKLEWWGAGVVICLERGADLCMAQLMPLPLTVSCFCKIQIGFNFLVQAHPGSPRQRVTKRVCMCVHAAVAVDSSHTTASSSASCSGFSPPSNFVNGHVSTMLFMVCCWPQSQEGDWANPICAS